MTGSEALALAKRTYAQWSAHNGWIFAGAMTAFAALAAAPIVLIALRVASALGREAEILRFLARPLGLVIGHGDARAVGHALGSSSAHRHGHLAIGLAVAAAIFAGSRFTYAMHKAMQTMWSSEPGAPQSLWTTLRDVLVAGTASALGIALLLALLFAGSELFASSRGAGVASAVGSVVERGAILVGAALLLVPVFGALFKWLPRSEMAWSDVWVGAATTAVVFVVGQAVIGAYLALRHVETMYGSVSAIVVLLLWLYYSAYMFLMGAEFTQVYARTHGSLADGRAARVCDGRSKETIRRT